MKCDHCAEPAVIISPGTEEVRDIFLLRRPTPDRHWCMACAKASPSRSVVRENYEAAWRVKESLRR